MSIFSSIRLHLRAACAARIPALAAPSNMQTEELAAATRRGLLHRLLIALDDAAGVFGAWVPCTISARTAMRLRACQWHEVKDGRVVSVTWHPQTPSWALALGAFLESIDHGHLAAAMRADLARATLVVLEVTGGHALHVVAKPDGAETLTMDPAP